MERSRSPSTKSLEGIDKPIENDSLLTKSSRPISQLLNSMSARVTNKPKYGGFFVSMQQKLRSCNYLRWSILFGCLFFFAYIAIYYLELPPAIQILDKDRSSSYKVKVLPALLSDEELANLPKESFSYLAMIDAGSSGCRAHVYRYGKLGSIDGPLYILPQHDSKKVKPGLSTFANNPTDAGPSLAGLVDFLKEQVPESDWSVTPIWLKATAGLRMLPTATSDAILESVRQYLLNTKNSPFHFRYSWARIIPGNEEGGFGWIAFNYLKKIIGPRKSKSEKLSPYAVIEMGGASAQVSQLAPSKEEAEKIPEEYRFSFTIEGEEYNLYTHSYLGYGAEQAKEQFNRLLKKETPQPPRDPCVHEGFVSRRAMRRMLLQDHRRRLANGTVETLTATIAPSRQLQNESLSKESSGSTNSPITKNPPSNTASSSSSSSCARSVSSLFKPISSQSDGAGSLCTSKGPHSFGCVYQPDFVAKSENILAFENFFYMSSALGVKPVHSNGSNLMNNMATTFPLETTPANIREASDKFCSLHWPDVQSSYPKDTQGKDVNMKSCFISGFAYSFLVDGLKIPAKKVITIQKEVGGSEIEWALGAAYKETADFLKRTNLRPT
jgi:Golgi nucleoside diphosphatase